MSNKYKDKIFSIVSSIPLGKVTTYGRIAKEIGLANPRVVGNLLHQNKDPKKIPCHRVIRSDGTLATGYGMGGREVQRKLLESEGVVFVDSKIDLNVFGVK